MFRYGLKFMFETVKTSESNQPLTEIIKLIYGTRTIPTIITLKTFRQSSVEHYFSGFNFNDYVDRCLLKLRGLIAVNLNPMLLEPTETSIQYGRWFFNFTAHLLLDNTKLHRLNEVRRSGLPDVRYQDKNLYLYWQMTFPELELTSCYLLKMLNNSSEGEIKAKVKNLVADVEFRCDFQDLKTKLHKLKLRTDRTVDIELGGDSGNVLGSAFLKAIANIFKNQILGSVEDALKENIQETLDGMQLINKFKVKETLSELVKHTANTLNNSSTLTCYV